MQQQALGGTGMDKNATIKDSNRQENRSCLLDTETWRCCTSKLKLFTF